MPADRPTVEPLDEWRRAPLAPVALAAAIGLTVDRTLEPGLGVVLAVLAAGVVASAWQWGRPPARLALGVATAALFAWHHQLQVRTVPPDDLTAHLAPAARVVTVRGVLLDEPLRKPAAPPDALSTATRYDRDAVTLAVTHLARGSTWTQVSGRVRLTLSRPAADAESPEGGVPLEGFHAGDAVEATGLFSRPEPPKNPGELDFRRVYADRRWRGDLRLNSPKLLTRLEGDRVTPAGVLARVRGHATRTLQAHLPGGESATARALLLGDPTAMDQAEWQAYLRTGVVHALVISGVHLAVLAGALGFAARLAGLRRAEAAVPVVLVVFAYAFLTGFRPSASRAAVMVGAVGLGAWGHWPVNRANAIALAWLVMAALDPADPFTLGSKLSFLSVIVLIWGVGPHLVPRELTPQEQLLREAEPPPARVFRVALRAVARWYLVTLVLTAVNAPLILAAHNVASPVALVIGPAVVALTELALLTGFLLLLVGGVPGLGAVVSFPVEFLLGLCRGLVTAAERWPYGVVYHPGPAPAWCVAFYALVALFVFGPRRWRLRVGLGLVALVAMPVGWRAATGRATDELRVAVLAVGKGNCAVIETTDGRVIVADVGTTAGPQAVERVVAPYLWGRNIRSIDEVIVSHADFDHFNGLGELCRRFPVGRVTLTPSFAEKPTREVAGALAVLKQYQIPSELIHRGQTRTAGAVEFRVLHPPKLGPPGTENERSLVLELTYDSQRILFAGDLEKRGTEMLLATEPRPSAVLIAPHHGARAALPPGLVAWCRPQLVIVSRGPPQGNSLTERDLPGGVTLWDTPTAGAVILRVHRGSLTAEAHLTGERKVVARSP